VLPLAVVGCIVVFGVLSSGVMGVRNGWPFSMYPAFDAKPPVTVVARKTTRPHVRPKRTRVVLQIETVSKRGTRLRPDLAGPLDWLPPVRRYTYVKKFATAIHDHPHSEHLVHALWQSLDDKNGYLNHVAWINIYRLVVSTAPKSFGRPLQRQVLASGKCHDCAR
jgi:hypothetical protein